MFLQLKASSKYIVHIEYQIEPLSSQPSFCLCNMFLTIYNASNMFTGLWVNEFYHL